MAAAPASPVAYPAHSAAVAQLVRQAGADGRAVVPRGSGSRQLWWPAPAVEHLILDLSGLRGRPEINAENLSARVPAGLSLIDLQAALAERGLWWPVEHLDAPAASVSGIISAGAANPGLGRYGRIRDWVLGLETVRAGGEVLPLGGQTMKNVAGYDLTRLWVGARGTLGVITAATLRLLPLPSVRAGLALCCADAAACARAASALLALPEPPDVVEWVGGGPDAPTAAAQLLVRCDGSAAATSARLDRAVAALKAAGCPWHETDPGRLAAHWQARADLHRRLTAGSARWLRLCLAVPAHAGPGLSERLPAYLGGHGWALAGHVTAGVYTLWLPDGLAGHAVAALQGLRQEVAQQGGLLWVEGSPQPLPPEFGARPPRPQDALEAALRQELAPPPGFNPHL